MTTLTCACGKVHLTLQQDPIMVVECCCDSCRQAAGRLKALPVSGPMLTAWDTTPYVMYRKDRVQIGAGADHLAEFRLTPKSSTRRVIATCCNTPMFLEFTKGHWLSLYADLWPEDARPQPEMRTMAGDLGTGAALPADIPNLRSHSLRFMARLMGAWVAMGFGNPKITVPQQLDA